MTLGGHTDALETDDFCDCAWFLGQKLSCFNKKWFLVVIFLPHLILLFNSEKSFEKFLF